MNTPCCPPKSVIRIAGPRADAWHRFKSQQNRERADWVRANEPEAWAEADHQLMHLMMAGDPHADALTEILDRRYGE